MTEPETDAMPLNDDELTPEERRHVRRLLLEDERASWARKKIKVALVAIAAVAAAGAAVWDWVVKHIKVVP